MVHTCFYHCCSHLDPKLEYCFITSTSLVRVIFLLGFSIAGLRNETEAASNTASTLLEHAHIINHMFRVYKCTCENIKVIAKLQRENSASNTQQTNKGSNLPKLFCNPNLHLHVCHEVSRNSNFAPLCTCYMYLHVIYNVVTSCIISERLKVFDQIIISNLSSKVTCTCSSIHVYVNQ